VQLFLLKNATTQMSRIDCDQAQLASAIRQLMSPATIFFSFFFATKTRRIARLDNL